MEDCALLKKKINRNKKGTKHKLCLDHLRDVIQKEHF